MAVRPLPPTASGGAPVELDWSAAAAADEAIHRKPHHMKTGHNLFVVGQGYVRRPRDSYLAAPMALLGEADVDSLGAAMRDPRRCCSTLPEPIYLGNAPPDEFEPELFNPEPVRIEVDQSNVYAAFELLVPRNDATGKRVRYAELLEPAVNPHGCEVASAALVDADGAVVSDSLVVASAYEGNRKRRRNLSRLTAEVRIKPKGPLTIAELLAAGDDAYRFLEAVGGGPIDLHSARNLLLAKLPHLLIGQSERDWFEVKGHPYTLTAQDKKAGARAKIELGQDVARFANGDVDALLVVGLVEDGQGVVKSVKPAKLAAISPKQHRDSIDSHVFPTIDGLTIDQVDLGDGKGLLVIRVPAQPEEQKPFLVHGAIVEGKAEGAFFSIVRRRDEGSITVSASQIHTWLVVGRALLRDMSASHVRQIERDLKAKSEEAARAVLATVATADDECHSPPGPGEYFTSGRPLALAAAIKRDAFAIQDDEVVRRVDCCRNALFSFGANVSNFPGDAGVATILLGQLLRATRDSLEAYIAEKALPGWINLPEAGNSAFAWLVERSRNPS